MIFIYLFETTNQIVFILYILSTLYVLFIYLSICLCVYRVYLFIYLSTYLSILGIVHITIPCIYIHMIQYICIDVE